MMERAFLVDGMMARSELSFPNQENYSMLSMMPTIMVSQLYAQPTTARE